MNYQSSIDEQELQELTEAYGRPAMRTVDIEGDEYLYTTRQYRSQDRRGEVVMIIEQPEGQVILHRKGWYEHGVYRLPTGGIDLGEEVETALIRELEEETGLTPEITCFLGVLDCRIHYESNSLSFVSYLFHLPSTEGVLRLPLSSNEDISDFRPVPIADLPAVARNLRQVAPPRAGWGRWRASAHDFVYEMLNGGSR